ncbi:MAG: tetratricopeptide repeat protein, partial [Planctomycetales bacterium]|nr:tetratricopeptide repeat protein [Planctomycetales bacterium]
LWAKFLADHPDDELAPRATHYLGICYMQVKPPQYAEAVKTYVDVPTKFPTFENLDDALLNLGWCQYQLGLAGDGASFPAADKTFAKLIERGKNVDQALYFQGESRYLSGDRKGAAESYAKLIADFPKSGLRKDAVYALGVAQEELGQYAEAGKTYDTFLSEFATGDDAAALATEVRMRKAETILQAGVQTEEGGKADDAKKLFAQAEKMFADAAAVQGFVSADHATYRQALCASKQGKFAEAGDLYAKVADNPQTTYLKEATLDAGRSYYQAQKYDEAQARFAKVIAGGTPDAAEAAHWTARILIDQKKQYAKAAKVAGDAIAKAAESPYLVNLKLDQADANYEIADKRADSMKQYAAIAADHADSPLAPQALYNAAYAALQLKDYAQALAHANAYLAKHSGHRLAPDVKYVAAESDLFEKKYPEAESLYADLVKSYPQHADLEQWRLRLGLSQFLQQKFAETVATLGAAAAGFQSKDNIAEAQYYVGASQYRLDKFAESITALQASYAANPKWRKSDEVLLDLARAQQKQDKFADAVATAKKMLAEFPDSELADRAHFQVAQCSYDGKDFKTASAEYAAIVKNWPQSRYIPYALYGQGWSDQQLGQDKEAITAFTALIDGHKDHSLLPSARNGRGIARQRTGDFAGGIEDFAAFLASNPSGQERADALYNRGLCEAGLKKYDVAAATYASILKDFPEYPTKDKVLYELAWAHKSQAQEKEAVARFAEIVAGYPDSPLAAEAYYHVGEGDYAEEKYDAAAKAYAASKAKAGKGDLGEKATYKLGWASYRQKQYTEALAAFDEQVKTYPEGSLSGDALFMVGECNFKLEKYDAALPALQKALAAAPASDTVKVLCLLHGGQSAAQLAKPNWQDAVKLLAQIPAEHADTPYLAEALYELGWANFNLDKQDEALTFWSQSAEKSDGALGARSRFMMGEVKFGKKDFEAAHVDYALTIFGYGGEAAEDKDLQSWKAKASLQAGQASAILAGEAADATKKAALLKRAKDHFQRVMDKYPQSDVASAAQSQLKKLGG